MNADTQAVTTNAPFTDDDMQRVSREESVTPFSILRAWVGLPVRGMAGTRATRAVAKLRGEVT